MKTGGSIIRVKHTSYDIVWATPRVAPKRAYLEFEAHPAPNIAYIDNLDIAIINKSELTKLDFEVTNGVAVHNIRAKKKKIGGVTKNNQGEAVDGLIFSLIKSFRPSAIG